MNSPTPGPWRVSQLGLSVLAGPSDPNGRFPNGRVVAKTSTDCPLSERGPNARLMAAAPDHALVARFLTVGLMRWESFEGREKSGELCYRGLRHTTHLDEFGVPALTPGLRAELQKGAS